MNPEELAIKLISGIIEEKELQRKISLFFPDEHRNLPEIIPEHNRNERTRKKKIDGYGSFYFLSRKGKKQFHEFVLDIICKELKSRAIKYTRPRNNRGEDLRIGNLKIELETRNNPPKKPETRPDLKRRIMKDPEHTIILCLNKKDKEIYLSSNLREEAWQGRNNKVLTIEEFLKKFRAQNKTLF